MAMTIKVASKDVMEVDGELYVAMTFDAYDGDDKVYDAVFVETENLAEACAGITEYGMLVFNTVNSADELESEVTIACSVGGSLVEADTSLEVLLETAVGEEVTDGTEAGGGSP